MSMTRLSSILGILLAGGVIGSRVYHRRQQHWGASEAEVEASLPGDDLVPRARSVSTMAITMRATPERVWPWLVQMGQGRGGLYSYDWLENLVGLDMHSADSIVPALQNLRPGDRVRMVPEGTEPDLSFVVTVVEPPHLLVLGPTGSREDALQAGLPYPCWTFRLQARDEDTTRLVVRFQSDFEPTWLGRLMNKYALLPVHFVMERKMLLGIKERAERAG
jgi:hypothetical protein